MRKFIIAAVLSLAASLGVVAIESPANADTPGCVTKKEWKKITYRMQMKRVHRITDTKGDLILLTPDNTVMVRGYPECGAGWLQLITYVKITGSWYVDAKDWA